MENQILTVPAVDLDDKNVLCFKRESPKSATCQETSVCQKLHPKLILTAGYYLLLHDLYLQLLSNLSHIVSYKKNELIEENLSSTNKPSHWTFWPNTSCNWVNKNQ